MTKWIVGESYQHKLSGVKIRMIGWTTDGRPVVERHEQPFDQYTCYDLAKCAIDFYDHVPQRVRVEDLGVLTQQDQINYAHRQRQQAQRKIVNCERECERRGGCTCE